MCIRDSMICLDRADWLMCSVSAASKKVPHWAAAKMCIRDRITGQNGYDVCIFSVDHHGDA